MAVKIRLSRAGAKKKPFYRVVVADSRSPRDGRFIERIGSYDPFLAQENPQRVRLDEERVKYWLSVGAQPTGRVALFLSRAGHIAALEQRERPKKSTPRKKAQERLKAAKEAASA